jgi:hypothetical protein
MQHKRLILIIVAAVAVMAAGVSYAAIPDSNGVISACKDSKGALLVIDAEAGQTCNAKQQPLSWNQQGPAGPPGTAGRQVVTAQSTNDSSKLKEAYATCPNGKLPIGGGARAVFWTSSGEFLLTELAVADSTPTHNGWGARAHEVVATSQPWIVRAYAICATVAP